MKILRKKGEISDDVILMADEMYLQKCTQFHGGEYIGADVEGNLYKGVVALIIQGLKKSISFVIKALPETKITGEWIAQHISECISCLSKVGFNVCTVVTDNHSSKKISLNSKYKKKHTEILRDARSRQSSHIGTNRWRLRTSLTRKYTFIIAKKTTKKHTKRTIKRNVCTQKKGGGFNLIKCL